MTTTHDDVRQRDATPAAIEHVAVRALAEHERQDDDGEQAEVAHPPLPEQRVARERFPVAMQRLLELRRRYRKLEGHPHRAPIEAIGSSGSVGRFTGEADWRERMAGN